MNEMNERWVQMVKDNSRRRDPLPIREFVCKTEGEREKYKKAMNQVNKRVFSGVSLKKE